MSARIDADQLDAATRKRLGFPGKARKRPKPSRAGVGDAGPCAGVCQCGRRYERFTDWERHSKQSGHSRWDIDIPELTEGATVR